MKKWLKYIMTIVIIAFLYLLLFPISVSINKTVSAVEISVTDRSFCKPVNITISGRYQWRLLSADTFTGNIQFDTYELTMEKPLQQADTVPALTLQDGTDSLFYGEWMAAQLFGYISCKPFFSKLAVQVCEPNGNGGSWSSADGHCIVAEATSREEALAVVKAFSNDLLPPYEYWTK
jgi:hypothetical protein